MAEVQKDVSSADASRRFVEFVLMHAQQAAFCLGQSPNPSTGKTEVHLEPARMFIDQLEMLKEKTRGNLSAEESGILDNVISNLQMAFVQVSASAGGDGAASGSGPESPLETPSAPAGDMGGQESKETAADAGGAASGGGVSTAGADSEPTESKKKFTKSYGA